MTDYGRVHSITMPEEIEITDTMVFIASNITPRLDDDDGGYDYDYSSYTKNEYIQLLSINNAKAISELELELKAAKILLGVD